MPYARAASAYRASAQLNTNPIDVLVAVHDELHRRLTAAKIAYEQGALDQMCRHTEAARLILLTLESVLDFAAAGEGGQTLRRFYRRLHRAINRILTTTNVSESVQSVIDTLHPMCVELRKRKNPVTE
ncbi:flagellar protein FliS [Phenylobacterium sp.]|uniref:flagellar protein FliS n=1 Tax=Phenylobacterium sp. TaxID=1871053 RepID=UPI0035AEF10A